MNVALKTTPDLFRAFADATRLRILNLLLEGEVCVCDLCAILDEVQPKISRHLAYLRRAGLVTVRNQGKWKIYSIAECSEGDCADGLRQTLLDCVRTCLRPTDVLQADFERLKVTPKGSCCP